MMTILAPLLAATAIAQFQGGTLEGAVVDEAGKPIAGAEYVGVRFSGDIPIMATDRVNDLQAFKGFIEEKLSTVGTNFTLDEALMNWEIENQTAEEREETLEAIQLGLDDMYAGRTIDAFEFVERMRQKLQSGRDWRQTDTVV